MPTPTLSLQDSFLALPLPPKFSLGEREQARRAAKRAKAKAAASDKGKGAAAAAASRSPASSVVVCGVNEVTRGLEQQRLGLVLLARSAGPPMLVNHLLAQAFAQGVPICAVTGLSEALAPRIGARNLVCLGITKVRCAGDGRGGPSKFRSCVNIPTVEQDAASGDGVFAALAKDVARLAPTPNLPWLLRPPASGQVGCLGWARPFLFLGRPPTLTSAFCNTASTDRLSPAADAQGGGQSEAYSPRRKGTPLCRPLRHPVSFSRRIALG